MSDNDIFGEFSSITGVTDEDKIIHYLSAADFQLQQAIDLYFASGTGSSDFDTSQLSGYTHPRDGSDDEQIRKPDEVKRARLIDESEPTHLEYVQKSRVKHKSAFGSAAPNSKNSTNTPTLASIFQAPTDISIPYQFDDTIDVAKECDKWMVVNIQSDSEFMCHQLNRDVWGDETVKDLIRCSFLFWQKLNISSEGEQYISRYKVSKFPYVSIINPITASVVWKVEGFFETSRLLEKLQDFLGNYASPSQWLKQKSAKNHTPEGTSSIGLEAVPKEDTAVNPSNFPVKDVPVATQQNHRDGFDKVEVQSQSDILTFDNTREDITVKIKFPSGQCIFKLPDTAPVLYLLGKICEQSAMNGCKNFEVIYGFPQTKLSDRVSFPEASTKSLRDVDVVSNSALMVRFLN